MQSYLEWRHNALGQLALSAPVTLPHQRVPTAAHRKLNLQAPYISRKSLWIAWCARASTALAEDIFATSMTESGYNRTAVCRYALYAKQS